MHDSFKQRKGHYCIAKKALRPRQTTERQRTKVGTPNMPEITNESRASSVHQPVGTDYA